MSRAARSCICVICGAGILMQHTGPLKKTCSPECRKTLYSNIRTGKKHTAEARANMSAAQRRKMQEDPSFLEQKKDMARKNLVAWRKVPENAAAAAKRHSETMRKRLQDPEFRKRRSEISSRVMKDNWEKYRAEYAKNALENYNSGKGISSEEAKRTSAAASSWILTRAQEALRTETDYNAMFAETTHRLRQEIPYIGPADSEEYYDYLKKIGTMVANTPELRAITDSFMREAIPRFAAEWQASKK